MRIALLALGLIPALSMLGCASPEAPHPTAGSTPSSSWALSQPKLATAPQGVFGEALAPSTEQLHPWYFSADGKLRVLSLPLRVGRNKVAWFRPDGAGLQVSGRRLDASAPPMTVDIMPEGYPHQFCPSLLFFPTEGYWEIVGKSGESELRAVVKVSSEPSGT
jgi:hypothetical protein